MSARRLGAALLLAGALGACGHSAGDTYTRGHDLQVADLPLADRVHIYQEAIGGSFQVGDPSLYLLLDPRLLPRAGGYGDASALSQATQNELIRSHIVQGTCVPTGGNAAGVAHCQAPLAGYVVRFTDVFRMHGDTMNVYLYVQRYSTPTSTGVGRLRFEREYKLVRQGSAWTAVAEGKLDVNSQ